MTDARTFGLTIRAVELLAVIRAWKVQHGCAPTYDEMARELGMATRSGVHRLIGQLEMRGLVRRLPGKKQSVQVVEPRTVSLPEDLYARLFADAKAQGKGVNDHLADAVRAFLPSHETAAREREWSSSPSPF